MNPSTVPSAVTLLAGHVLPLPPFTSESLVFLFGFFEVVIIVVVGMANKHAIHEYSICILQFAICIRLVLWRRSHTHAYATTRRYYCLVIPLLRKEMVNSTSIPATESGRTRERTQQMNVTYARKGPKSERTRGRTQKVSVREEGH